MKNKKLKRYLSILGTEHSLKCFFLLLMQRISHLLVHIFAFYIFTADYFFQKFVVGVCVMICRLKSQT